MVDRTCAGPGCGKTFTAKRRNSRYCSAVCRAAHGRSERIATGTAHDASPGRGRSITIPNPRETRTKLMAKSGISPDRPLRNLRWEQEDDVTWRLMDGRRAVAHVVDRGHPFGVTSWHALCNGIDISPADIEGCGISADATLPDAKMVAEAMATGDIGPLIDAAHSNEDVTDDMILNLDAFLRMVETASGGSR